MKGLCITEHFNLLLKPFLRLWFQKKRMKCYKDLNTFDLITEHYLQNEMTVAP